MTSARTASSRSVRFDFLAVWCPTVAFSILIGFLAWASRGWAAPVMIVAVVALAAYYVRVLGLQAGLVLLLIVTSFVDRYTFRVGSFDIRPEEVAALGTLAVLAVARVREGDRAWLRPSLAEGLLLAWFACNAASSLLASPDRRLSVKILLLVGVCSLGLFLPRRLIAGPQAAETLEIVTRWLLIVFATEATYGLLAYVLHVFGSTISVTPNPASGHLSAYGTLWEQNVFGAVAAAGAVVWVYLGPARFRHAWFGIATCMGGLIASLTRAAWLAAAIVGAIGVGFPGLRRRFDVRALAIGLLGGLVVGAAVLLLDGLGTYTVPVPGLGGASTTHRGVLAAILNMTDFIGRLNQTGLVWADIHGRNLLLGRGTASFEALNVAAGVPEHIASLPLLVLNDTGLVGVVIFACFVVAVGARAWARRSVPTVAAFGQMALIVGLTNLATQTTELMIGWLLIGILLAACDVTSATSPPPVARPDRGRSDTGQSNL